MNYRYASGSVDCQDMLDDIDRALKEIRSMANSRGVNADKVMLVGFSAGGHLALLYSYTRKASAPIEPVAVVSYSGPTDFTSKKFVEKNALSDADYMRSLLSKLTGEKITAMNFDSKKKALLGCSPVNYVSADCVPTMIVQGAKDKIVYASDTRNFVKKLKASGVTYKYYELPNSGHTLGGDEEAFEKYDHPLHAEYTKLGEKGGHGGMDWLVCRAFVEAVKNGTNTPIDAYDTVTWMSIASLSEMSIQRGGSVVDIPDFTRGKWFRREPAPRSRYSLDEVVTDDDTPIF